VRQEIADKVCKGLDIKEALAHDGAETMTTAQVVASLE
jgi:hypothetical protein